MRSRAVDEITVVLHRGRRDHGRSTAWSMLDSAGECVEKWCDLFRRDWPVRSISP
jgi:hypothetical protein